MVNKKVTVNKKTKKKSLRVKTPTEIVNKRNKMWYEYHDELKKNKDKKHVIYDPLFITNDLFDLEPLSVSKSKNFKFMI